MKLIDLLVGIAEAWRWPEGAEFAHFQGVQIGFCL
jgi:hypothetical protein